MPNLNDTRKTLEKQFVDNWGTTTKIKFDNTTFNDKNVESFVSLILINYVTDNVCIGSAIAKRIRHEGVLSIKIYVKQSIGMGLAYQHVDQVRGIMDNLIFSNLFTTACLTRRNGASPDGWVSMIVDVPYISDEE